MWPKTTLDGIEIEAYGHRTLAEILASVRGLYVGTDRNYHYVGARGFWRPGDYNSRLLLLQDGREVEAVEALNRALEVARDQGAKTFELSTAIDLARLYEKQGKKEAARAILTPIYEWFAEGFDSPGICAARALLNGFNKGS